MKVQHDKNFYQGFTLFEILIVVAIVGVLVAIATPSWVAFFHRQQLNAANNKVYQAMRQAQSKAQQERVTWQASFKQENEIVKWAVHRTEDAPDAYWEEFPESIQIDPESNLPESGDVYRVRFNYKGCPVYNPSDSCTNTTIRTKGRLTLSLKNGGATKRCVIVSTLLGALRSAQEQSTPDNGKYCY